MGESLTDSLTWQPKFLSFRNIYSTASKMNLLYGANSTWTWDTARDTSRLIEFVLLSRRC